MSARDRAEQLRALLRHPEHVEQAVAILESLDDDAVKHELMRSFRSHAPLGRAWHISTIELRILIACGAAVAAAADELHRIRLDSHQLSRAGIAAVLQLARELVIDARVRGEPLGELSVLPPLPRARTIFINQARVDLSGLHASPELAELSVFGSDIDDAELSLHPSAPLRVLRLHDAPRLASLSGLDRYGELEWLEVTGARLRDLTPLAKLSRLRMLDLRNCALTSLEPLRDLRELRVIALAGTGMTLDDLPSTIRPYATWSPEPRVKLLGERPVHPDTVVV